MSNNNHPHSHLSQAAAAAAQNPSWNPLQIPSYIPRQPQLAHMSNERPMVRSPLAWQQPPPPPDAIYNFMSANHKNLDHHHQMNPLLAPPYTGTLPFDSMDLSLQSTRSAAPPLSKSGLPQQQQQQHQQQQQQSHLHAPPPNFPSIHNLSTSNATTQQEQLTALAVAHAERLLNSNNLTASAVPTPTSTPNVTATPSKYLNANGSDCESLLPPPPPTTTSSTSTATASNHNSSSSSSSGPGSGNNNLSSQSPTPHYMHQNRDDSFKLSQLKQRNFEKDKECRIMQQQQPSLGNKKPSPLRNYHHQQQQAQQLQQQSPYNMTPKYNGPQTPPTPQSPLAGPLPPPPHQMDYNQLHLHHQLGGGYQHMQQSAPAASQDQHLHYHNQHVLPSHHPTHISSAQFHAQANLPGQQQLPPQHQQAQAGPPMHHHSRNSQQLTNLDLLPKQPKQTDMDIERERDEQTVITDLSYRHTTTTPALPPPPASSSSSGETEKPAAPSTASHDAPESPYLTTSNEESLESNSNSNSNSRKRRKRKSSLVMRLTPSENASATKHTHGNSNSSPKQTTKNGTSSAGGDFQPFQQTEMPMVMENGRASSPAQTENSNSNNSTSLYNDDNPKTKKQRQALLQRNLTEQQHRHHPIPEDEPVANPTPPTTTVTMPPPPSPQSNSSSSSSSSSSHSSHSSHDEKQQPEPPIINNKSITDTPASPALVEQGDIDAKPAVSVHEQEDDDNEVDEVVTTKTDDNSKAPETSPKPPTPPVQSTATSAPSSEPIVVPPNAAEPRHFGEVEDKLEQMFAGIEEETEAPAEKPAEQEAKVNDVVGHDLSAQLAMDSAKSEEIKPTPPVPEVRPIATKAAMKSTLPSPIHSPMLEARSTSTPLPESQLAEESQDSSKSQPVRSAPQRRLPQRRLSIGMDAALLRFTLDDTASQAKTKKTVGRKKLPQPDPEDSDDDDKPSTSAAAAAALAARNKLNETANIKNNNSKTSTTTTKKSPIAKGKSKKAAVGKTNNKNSKQNGKNSKGGGGRKPISTDEDSTPAPHVNGGSSSLPDLKFKSPYILIKPDGTFSIKNTHSSEDINEKQTKAKKAPHERKNLRGMHSSTLSNRYDADTTDSSWICVFCKRGPHKLGLGDLFGPYLVSIDCDEYRAALHSPGVQDIDGLFVSKRKRGDMVKAQQRNLPVVQASLANIMQAPKISMHKRKRKQPAQDCNNSFSDDQFDMQSRCSSSMADPLDYSQENKLVETFRGMCKTSEHGYEIWLHEDCAIWTNDIQLIGAHVNGLDAAVWDSTRYQCVHCSQTGANVCCFQRSCKATAHVPCARSANWHLNEHERKVFCQLHGPSEGSHAAAVEEPAAGTIGNDSMALESLQLQQPVLLNINSLP
ncbi:uncharacterized protein Dwil_GK22244 [Drosophila willistoni]|uniref:PHD-type domain-containing protein n=1 Tax=Drosophila willistoni TaxID=7260 RepID=B4MYL6_DROWI|nr:uncharacterized protein Dwil_GK22244 [Drosophila willistoni]